MGDSAQSPIIVVGMHRSGTTMITRLLEQAGLFMGTKKQGDDEALFFLELNEWLLKSAGGAWDNPQSMDHLLGQSEYRALVTDYLRAVLDSRHLISYLGFSKYLRYRSLHKLDSPWGWKDPRNSYALPIWLDIFPQAKILHIYRNGIDVAQSLRVRAHRQLRESKVQHALKKKRGNYWIKRKSNAFVGSSACLDLNYAFGLWERYTETVIKNMEAANNSSCTVKYEDFLADPLHWLTHIVNFSGLDVTDKRLASLVGQVQQERAYAYKSEPELVRYYASIQDSPLIRRLGYA